MGVGTIYRVATLSHGATSGVVSAGTVLTLRGAAVLGGGGVEMSMVISGAVLGEREPSNVTRL